MRINFCVFNHPRRGILDQIWFVETLFKQKGYDFSCSELLDPGALNLVLENFVATDVELIEGFCRKWGKSIGLIMSEHVEVENQRIVFNSTPLTDVEYIGNKMERFFSAFSMVDLVFAFFALGELPRLRTLNILTPTHSAFHLPYPKIVADRRPRTAKHDILFTGSLTDYRRQVLEDLEKKFDVIVGDIWNQEDQRDKTYRLGNVAMNIPQIPSWPWTSPMRVLYGLRVGVPTYHYGRADDTMFSRAVLCEADLDDFVDDPRKAWEQQMAAYSDLVASDFNPRFPTGLFDTWGELEDVD